MGAIAIEAKRSEREQAMGKSFLDGVVHGISVAQAVVRVILVYDFGLGIGINKMDILQTQKRKVLLPETVHRIVCFFKGQILGASGICRVRGNRLHREIHRELFALEPTG